MLVQIVGYFILTVISKGLLVSSSCIVDSVKNATCDFESGPCEYQLSPPWIRTSAFKGIHSSIPSAHESNTFVLYDLNEQGDGHFTSPLINNGTYCLSFWYYLTGDSIHLEVETSSGNKLADIQNTRESWKPFSVTIQEKSPFKFTFKRTVSSSSTKFYQRVGIDDVLVGVRACKEPVNRSMSSFDHQTRNAMTLKERWRIQDGTFHYQALSISDRNGSAKDSFALFQAFRVEMFKADALSTQCMSPGKYCINFWIIAPFSRTDCKLFIHTIEGHKQFMTIGKVSNWTEYAIPMSTTLSFEIKIHPYAYDSFLPNLHRIKPHMIIGIDDIDVYPINNDEDCKTTSSKPITPMTVKISSTNIPRYTTSFNTSSIPITSRKSTMPRTISTTTTVTTTPTTTNNNADTKTANRSTTKSTTTAVTIKPTTTKTDTNTTTANMSTIKSTTTTKTETSTTTKTDTNTTISNPSTIKSTTTAVTTKPTTTKTDTNTTTANMSTIKSTTTTKTETSTTSKTDTNTTISNPSTIKSSTTAVTTKPTTTQTDTNTTTANRFTTKSTTTTKAATPTTTKTDTNTTTANRSTIKSTTTTKMKTPTTTQTDTNTTIANRSTIKSTTTAVTTKPTTTKTDTNTTTANMSTIKSRTTTKTKIPTTTKTDTNMTTANPTITKSTTTAVTTKPTTTKTDTNTTTANRSTTKSTTTTKMKTPTTTKTDTNTTTANPSTTKSTTNTKTTTPTTTKTDTNTTTANQSTTKSTTTTKTKIPTTTKTDTNTTTAKTTKSTTTIATTIISRNSLTTNVTTSATTILKPKSTTLTKILSSPTIKPQTTTTKVTKPKIRTTAGQTSTTSFTIATRQISTPTVRKPLNINPSSSITTDLMSPLSKTTISTSIILNTLITRITEFLTSTTLPSSVTTTALKPAIKKSTKISTTTLTRITRPISTSLTSRTSLQKPTTLLTIPRTPASSITASTSSIATTRKLSASNTSSSSVFSTRSRNYTTSAVVTTKVISHLLPISKDKNSYTTAAFAIMNKSSSTSDSLSSEQPKSGKTYMRTLTNNQYTVNTTQSASPSVTRISTTVTLDVIGDNSWIQSKTSTIIGGSTGAFVAFCLIIFFVCFYIRYKAKLTIDLSNSTEDNLQGTFDSRVKRYDDVSLRQLTGINNINTPKYDEMDMQPISNNAATRFIDRSFDVHF